MSNKIRESRLIPYNIQAGEGVPTHLSPAGTFYFDSLSGVTYQNIDGLSNWKYIFGENNHPTDIFVTGGTYSNGTTTFTNNTGGTFTVTGYYTGYTAPTDIRVTGGTYSNGTTTFTNNTGGTFTVTGYKTNDVFVTGGTYSNNTFNFTNNTGGTFNVLFNTVTGLTVNGNLTVTGNTALQGLTTTTISGDSLSLAASASTINLTNTSQQQIKFYSGGIGAPQLTTYSPGVKLILNDNIDSSISTGMAIGVDTGILWYGSDLQGDGHEWYAGTRKLSTLIGAAGFQLYGLGSPTSAAFTISGTSSLGSKGGLGYMDFLRVNNNYPSATNANKWFRTTSGGTLQILRSDYNATIFDLTDGGVFSVGGGNVATTTSNDGTSNYLSFNSNSSQIYDDGNFHIHSRNAGASMWINTNGAQLNLLTQSPTSSGGIGSGIAIATTTLNGYVTINTGRTVTTAAAYGYLTTGGAGTYPGGSQSVSISLYANNRIWGQEIDAFSDERMKDIKGEVTLEEGLKLVKNLKPIKYTWKEGDDKGIKIGYSAQQVSKAGFDHLVSLIPREGLEERIDDDGFVSPKDTQFSMNYDQVTPYHGVVIKHLLEKVQELEKQIQELKNK